MYQRADDGLPYSDCVYTIHLGVFEGSEDEVKEYIKDIGYKTQEPPIPMNDWDDIIDRAGGEPNETLYSFVADYMDIPKRAAEDLVHRQIEYESESHDVYYEPQYKEVRMYKKGYKWLPDLDLQ